MIACTERTTAFLYCLLYARLPAAPPAGVPAAQDTSAMADLLCTQPRRSCWCKQEDFESDMGLEAKALNFFYDTLCRGSHGKKKWARVAKNLKRACVFRHQGSTKPTRVWWLAFTGEGGEEPRFSERGEDNSFIVDEDGAVEEVGSEAGTCVAEGGKGRILRLASIETREGVLLAWTVGLLTPQ